MTWTDEERIKIQREVILKHLQAEDDKQWPEVYETFARADEKIWYDAMPYGTRFHGLKGIHEFYQSQVKALPDFRVNLTHEWHMPGCSVLEVTITATHQGEYMGIPPSGRKIAIEMCALFLFGDDPRRIRGERVYFDNHRMMQQMRGEEVPPTLGLLELSRRGKTPFEP